MLKNRIRNALGGIIKYINIIREYRIMKDLIKNQKKLSYYDSSERKNRFFIITENLYYLLKFSEANKQYFLYHFDRKSNPIDQKKYLPYPIFRKLRNKKNIFSPINTYVSILRNKYVFSKYLQGLNIPTPKIIGEIIDDNIIFSNNKKVNIKDVKNLDFFCKSFYGEEANGVFHLQINNGNIIVDGKNITYDEFMKKKDKYSFLQEKIIQAGELSKLYSKSVNTIRVVTVMMNNEIILYNSILKIGGFGNTCDNWHLGGVIVGINQTTGELLEEGLLTQGYGYRIKEHPETKVKFQNFKIPFYSKAIEQAILLHKNFINIKSIGWDIAITENGPVFIEGNDNWDFVMFQAYYGPQMKRLCEILKD